MGESHTLVLYNRSASRINYIGLQVYPVSEYEFGESLPYPFVESPNVYDKWVWDAGKRTTGLGTLKDRYLYLQKHFKATKDGKKNDFRSKTSMKKYFKFEYFGMDIN